MNLDEFENYNSLKNWDFSPEMIKTANQNKLKYPNKNIDFIVMNNFNMTFLKTEK